MLFFPDKWNNWESPVGPVVPIILSYVVLSWTPCPSPFYLAPDPGRSSLFFASCHCSFGEEL